VIHGHVGVMGESGFSGKCIIGLEILSTGWMVGGQLSGKAGVVKKPVLLRCRYCGGVYPSGVYMDKRSFQSQGGRVHGLKSKCPFCKSMNDSSNCGMVLSA